MRSEPRRTVAQTAPGTAPGGAVPIDWNGSGDLPQVGSYPPCPTVQGGPERVSHPAASMLFLEMDNTKDDIHWLKPFSNFLLASESSTNPDFS